MSEKKCSSQEASFYVNDLFELLEIKGNNQLLFNQFCSLLMKFDKETIKKAWKDIVYSCEVPNGQMAGRLPKMFVIEKILMSNRIEKWNVEHKKNKKKEIEAGTISKLFNWGIEYHEGKITKQELEKRIDENL
jgi:hypothetical protein